MISVHPGSKHKYHHHAAPMKPVMEPATLKSTVIEPVLRKLGLYSLEAEKLLLGTAAIESQFVFVTQMGGGPARGLFQMEVATFDDLMNRFLAAKPHRDLRTLVLACATEDNPGADHMKVNHAFAAAMARVKYYTIHKKIPSSVTDQAQYWSVYYNGVSPHGLRPADYLDRWSKYCAPLYA